MKCSKCSVTFQSGDSYVRVPIKRFLFKTKKIVMCKDCFFDKVCIFCKRISKTNPCKDCISSDD